MAIPTQYTIFDHLTFQIQETLIHDDLQATVRHGMNLRVAAAVAAIFTALAIFVGVSFIAGSFSATFGLSAVLLLPITVLAIGLYDTYKIFRCFHNYVWTADKQRRDNDQVDPELNDIYKWVRGNKPQWFQDMQWHTDTSIMLPLFAYFPLGRMR